MRAVLAALALVLATSSSHAISRYNIGNMSCGEVRSILEREGAAVLRYTSRRGLPLYDRYVSDGRFCAGTEYAYYSTVPTRDDRSCPVQRCRTYSNNN